MTLLSGRVQASKEVDSSTERGDRRTRGLWDDPKAIARRWQGGGVGVEGRAEKKVRCCQAHVSGGAWPLASEHGGMETLKMEENLQICAMETRSLVQCKLTVRVQTSFGDEQEDLVRRVDRSQPWARPALQCGQHLPSPVRTLSGELGTRGQGLAQPPPMGLGRRWPGRTHGAPGCSGRSLGAFLSLGALQGKQKEVRHLLQCCSRPYAATWGHLVIRIR